MMFDSEPNASRILAGLAEILFEELQSFGRLSGALDLNEENLRFYMQERSSFIVDFLSTLETHCGLRFSPRAHVPFCYNSRTWPELAPVAGYAGVDQSIAPSQVATSLILCWNLRLKGMLGRRVLVSALWIVAEAGLDSGIDFVFDLHNAGYADRNVVREVISLLLLARASCSSDEEMIMKFLGTTPGQPQEWVTSDISTEWVTQNKIDQSGWGSLGRLLQMGSKQAALTRDASSLDEWVLGNALLAGLLPAIMGIVNDLSDNLPLAWRAKFSQWEEIAADAGAIFGVARAGFNLISPYVRAGHVRVVAEMFRRQVGDGWQERLARERLLVPSQLQVDYDSGEYLDMPAEWRALSWRLIHPWVALLHPGENPEVLRVKGYPAEEFLQLDYVRQILAQNGILGEEAQKEKLVRYLSSAGTDSADEERLMRLLDDALYPRYGVLRSVRLHDELLTIISLQENSKYSDAMVRSRSLLSCYPYLGRIFLELAIAYDMSGTPEVALEYLIAGITLQPENPIIWHSISVVLNKLGNEGESIIAEAFHELLSSRR
jgi:hypothetical protein